MAKPSDTYTVEEFITEGQNVTLTHNNLSFIEKISNSIHLPVFNVLDDYMEELKALTVTIELNDLEYLKYAYKPKLLANDIYGNPELYFIILLLNGICDVKEFNKKRIKMISVENLNEALTFIYNAEKKTIDVYNNK